jgi:hypothetical protein
MLKTGHYFQYEAPEGWEEAVSAGRYTYRGARNEELTISTAINGEQGPPLHASSVGDEVLQAALTVAQKGASRPDLKIFKPLYREEGVSALPCWTVLSRTLDEKVLFATAVLQSSGGLMLITLEAPFGPEAMTMLGTFLKSVREPTH